MIKKLIEVGFLISTFAIFISPAKAEMTLSSSSISSGKIDKAHACQNHGGNNKSIPIDIKGIPAGTSHLAIIMDDPDAQSVAGYTWVHWNVFNINVSSDVFSLATGQKPAGDIGKNDGSSRGYGGMCPPNGKHTYRVAVFALKEKVDVKISGFSAKTYTIEAFEKKFKNSIIEKTVLNGDFG